MKDNGHPVISPESGAPPQLWGGVECTVNRVGGRYHDQLGLTGHGGRFDDLDRIAALGIRRLRYPLLWERIAPDGLAAADWRWADSRLSRLRALGISPIAGLLHHGSGPSYATLLDDRFPERFAEYAAAVSQRYPWIDAYTPINEPLTTARFAALYGHWFPHARSDAAFVRAVLNQCRATALAMRAIRSVNPAALLVQTDDAGKTFSTAPLAYQARFENHRRWLAWDLLSGRVNPHHPLWRYLSKAGATTRDLGWFLDHPCPPDIVGLNYYLTSDRFLDEQIGRYPQVEAGGNGRDVYVDIEAVRACQSISGHGAILQEAWRRYQTPVAITEAHLGGSRDEQMRWLVEAWNAAHGANRAGVVVAAVTAWALFGLSDWDSLLTRVDGHYEPGAYDARGPVPRPTALAALIQDLTAGREPGHPAIAAPGWWRREGRLRVEPSVDTYPHGYPPKSVSTRSRQRFPSARPILISGARGTLGHAFAKICRRRGWYVEALPREQLDIEDARSIASAIAHFRPWAVINAAGFVRVDAAEADEAACRRANTEGPALLAHACARAAVRLVTFSSDLVFDGMAGRPYVESDQPAPLSAYGRSKADSEAAVIAACPEALVVRSSAFFGPWDQWNTVHLALEAMSAGAKWRAATDQRVSPTYVPDLVEATLDLLIDNASGLWHLVNAGSVSWADLVRMAAEAAGYSAELVEECSTASLGLAAARPAYSVLATERGQMLPPLDDALRRFMDARRASIARDDEAGSGATRDPADRRGAAA